MKRLTIILVVLVIAGFAIVLPARASNASPAIVWQKSLGGSAYDNAFSIVQTSDGGYIVTGTSFSDDGDVMGNHGDGDYWIVKLDTKGNLTWQKSLGGSWIDEGNDIVQTSDGGYIIAGYSNSNDGDVTGHHGITGRYLDIPDAWVVKLDAKGNLTWQKSLGGSQEDNAHSIVQTSDGGYIIAGYSKSNDGDVTGNHGGADYWIIKLNAKGNLTWQRSLGGSRYDKASSIAQTSDGGYVIAGYSESNDGDVTGNHGNSDYWIVKLDAKGNLTWQKSLGGSTNDEASSIVQTSDGGYIIAGYSESNDGDVTGHHGESYADMNYSSDAWVVKLDAKGNLTWQRSLGGSQCDKASSIVQTSDGGYIIAGYSESNDGDVTGHDGGGYWIVKLDAKGNLIWQRAFGGSGSDLANSIILTSDGGYIVAGFSASTDGDVTSNKGGYDYWIVKLSQALYTPTPRIITNKTTPAMYTDTFQMSCTYPPCPSQAFCPEGQTCPGGCGLTCPKNYTHSWTVTPSTKPTGTQKSPLSYASAGALLGAGLLFMKRRK